MDELRHREDKIEYGVRLEEQMSFAEAKADEVLAFVMKSFVRALSEKLEKDIIIVETTSYKSYRNIMNIVTEQILKFVKHSFKENHYVEMDSSDFEEYSNKKVEACINMGTEILNVIYATNEDITRNEVYEINMNEKSMSVIKPLMKSAFIKAREIAFKYDKELKEIRKEREEIINKFD